MPQEVRVQIDEDHEDDQVSQDSWCCRRTLEFCNLKITVLVCFSVYFYFKHCSEGSNKNCKAMFLPPAH